MQGRRLGRRSQGLFLLRVFLHRLTIAADAGTRKLWKGEGNKGSSVGRCYWPPEDPGNQLDRKFEDPVIRLHRPEGHISQTDNAIVYDRDGPDSDRQSTGRYSTQQSEL